MGEGLPVMWHTPLPAEATGLTGAAVCLAPGLGSGLHPHCLHDRTPSCLTRRWWAAAWPRVCGQMPAGPGELVLTMHTDGLLRKPYYSTKFL